MSDKCPRCLEPSAGYIVCTHCGLPTKHMDEYRKNHAVFIYGTKENRNGGTVETVGRTNASTGRKKEPLPFQGGVHDFVPDSGEGRRDQHRD